MRVTSNTFPETLITNLGNLAARTARLQAEAATGRRIQSVSDDPAAMRRVLDLQAEAGKVGQYQKNIARQQELGDATYSSLQSLKKISDRAGEIATLADGLKSPQELAIYANEIDGLIKQGVQVMNATNRGDYLFAGTKTDQPPFVSTTNAAGQVTSVTYQGNESQSASEIAEGVTVSAQVFGANTSGNGPRGVITDSSSGADFFNHLISLRDNLLAGDTGAIASSNRAQLSQDEDNIIYHVSLNGSVQSRLEASNSTAQDRSTALTGQVSKEADADLTQTLVRLNATQTAYQVALQSGGKILSMSLLDYLR